MHSKEITAVHAAELHTTWMVQQESAGAVKETVSKEKNHFFSCFNQYKLN